MTVSIFYKLRVKLSSSILRMIYFAFVHSHLLYGVEVYANTTANHLSKLIILNNKLLRILQFKSLKTYNSELYKTYFTLPLELLHNFQKLLFIQSYLLLFFLPILKKINYCTVMILGKKRLPQVCYAG